MSIRTWYKIFLRMSEAALKKAVDAYNRNMMPKNARLALETIDGLDLDD